MFLKIIILLISTQFLSVYALNLKPGTYTCDYKYKDSNKENEHSKTRIRIVDDTLMHLIEMETEVTDTENKKPHLEFIPFLELPKKDQITKGIEQAIGFNSIKVRRHFETKKCLFMKYDFFGHWFARTEEKIFMKIKRKNKIKIRMKSKDKIEKFSSQTKLSCQWEN